MSCSPTQAVWKQVGCMSLGSNLQHFLTTRINGIDIVTAQSYIIVLWSVWLHRNLFIWKGTAASPTHMIQTADNFLQHWVERTEGAPNVVNDFRASWSRPEQGFLKCNVDAATFSNAGCTSFTTVLRDHDGQFIRGLSGFVDTILDP
ncbi:hypothetical protein Gotri_020701 [Gossypium trilobum]|uniref:RNase H type-1 domain-containing protein n=1 Tax=Gossypium trilobum TaxID=34281 RepID=A0A7J9DA60_9ROSI|nr:hypothetical protein [Gossypium trilobum]